jgi:hypothetical protein
MGSHTKSTTQTTNVMSTLYDVLWKLCYFILVYSGRNQVSEEFLVVFLLALNSVYIEIN